MSPISELPLDSFFIYKIAASGAAHGAILPSCLHVLKTEYQNVCVYALTFFAHMLLYFSVQVFAAAADTQQPPGVAAPLVSPN